MRGASIFAPGARASGGATSSRCATSPRWPGSRPGSPPLGENLAARRPDPRAGAGVHRRPLGRRDRRHRRGDLRRGHGTTRSGRAPRPSPGCTSTRARRSGWSPPPRWRSPRSSPDRLGLTGALGTVAETRRRRLHRPARRASRCTGRPRPPRSRRWPARVASTWPGARPTPTPPTTSRCSRSSATPARSTPTRPARPRPGPRLAGPRLPHRTPGRQARPAGRRRHRARRRPGAPPPRVAARADQNPPGHGGIPDVAQVSCTVSLTNAPISGKLSGQEVAIRIRARRSAAGRLAVPRAAHQVPVWAISNVGHAIFTEIVAFHLLCCISRVVWRHS